MKVKTCPSKSKPLRKSLSSTIQKKKFSKPTSSVLKNIVKITDGFEDLKSGNDLTGIACSKTPKPVKNKSSVISKETPEENVPKKSIKTKKKVEKFQVAPKQKKPKKETIVNGDQKVSLKSKVMESCLNTEEITDGSQPKLDIDKVEAAVKALYTLIKSDSSLSKNELWDEPTPLHLVITAVKMGIGPKRVIRIALPNSLVTDTTDICLIVPDLIRGRNVDHEKTYYHYKDLLAQNGITNIKTILPARQIRVEYNEYEARRNLCHSHDIFLIDQKINGFLVKKLGKEFYIKRKLPITVKLTKKHLKAEIESKLHKTSFFLDYKGTTKTVQVGHMQQTPRQVAENIIAIFDNLAHNYPGGLKNIRCLLIKSATSESLPIYYSLVSRNDVKGPYTKSKVYSKDKEVEGELFGKRVLVKPSGDIVVLSGSEEESDFDDDDNDVKVLNKTNDDDDDDDNDDNDDDDNDGNDNDEQSDCTVDKENEDVSTKKENSGSEGVDTESDDGDNAEAEYLIEFEQTKKLQAKKKHKQECEKINETNNEEKETLGDTKIKSKKKRRKQESVNTNKINDVKNENLDDSNGILKLQAKKKRKHDNLNTNKLNNVKKNEATNENMSSKAKNKKMIQVFKKKKLNKN